MPLTNIDIKNARPRKKPFKLFDGGGLYLLISPKGGTWWRFDYKFGGKRKTMSFGVFPQVSLREARQRREEAKRIIDDGGDPSATKKVERTVGMTYGELALEWYGSKKSTWVPRHAESVIQRINNYILPDLKNRPATGITANEIFGFLQRIEKSGKIETAHRVKQIMSMIFRYGIAKGTVERDPVTDLGRGMLAAARVMHYPTIIEPERVGALLRAIDGYEALMVRYAMQLHILTFVRPGELRHAEWSEIKWDDSLWEIPPERMKKKRAHVVPLSRQALEILKKLHAFTGNQKLLFPGRERNYFVPGEGERRPISNVTMNAALRRLGYDTSKDITSHGARAMARTLLHEKLRYPPEVIEHQLAHSVPDTLGEAYNRTKFIDERKVMMQAWADYLDELRRLTVGAVPS